MTATVTLNTAEAAYDAGLCVVPPREDESKAPLGDRWKHRQTERTSLEEIRMLYAAGRAGIGTLTGRVSGGLECLDVELDTIYRAFKQACDDHGVVDLLERIEAGYLEATPDGGVHLLYRCDEISGNRKLARRPTGNPEHPVETLMEIKAEGGYVILAPSGGPVHESGRSYRQLRGTLATIVRITPDEREALHSVARLFDEMPRAEFIEPRERAAGADGTRPGDDFNVRARWEDILEPAGWRRIYQRGEVTYWRRPSKTYGISATTNFAGSELFYPFTTSSTFDAERGYSKWRTYAMLHHAGDFHAAAKALAQQGYGTGSRQRFGPNGHHAPKSYHLSDLGNAQRLVDRHRPDIRYCHPWARWLVYDGRRWTVDDSGEITRRAKETVQAIYAEATTADDEQRKALAKWAIQSENERRIKSMIELAKSELGVPVQPDELDQDPWLLNTKSGTVDLRTSKLRPHCREDLITKLAPVTFEPEATCPTFEAFINTIMGGSANLIAFLQRAIGYSLTGSTREQVMFIAHGTGSNGKTTLLADTILPLLGDYAQQTPTDTLMVKRGETIPNDLARLKGARLVAAVESDEGRRLSEALIKQLTGGDRIAARFMRSEWFEFTPAFKIWLGTNHKPVVRGTDHAIWRRIRLIPFNVTIPDAEQDKQLPDKLRAELPGILRWAVEGCLAWQRDGLGAPDEVTQATTAYREEMDVVGGWITDCCVTNLSAAASAKALYTSYTEWCEANGERPQNQRAFGARLTERGFRRFRGTGNRNMWEGIGLKSYPSPDESYPNEAPKFPRQNHGNEDSSYPSYPKSGINASELPRKELTGNQGNLGNLGNSSGSSPARDSSGVGAKKTHQTHTDGENSAAGFDTGPVRNGISTESCAVCSTGYEQFWRRGDGRWICQQCHPEPQVHV
jgi:P4 family phage/plasmid primase-like protien